MVRIPLNPIRIPIASVRSQHAPGASPSAATNKPAAIRALDALDPVRPKLSSPAQFPEQISVKTPRMTFNRHFYYLLDDCGRVWMKSIPGVEKTKDIAPAWTLVDGTGVPHSTQKGFVTPERIESISADQDEIVARAPSGRFYSMRFFANGVFKESTPPRTWTDKFGWPVEAELIGERMVLGRRTRNYANFEDRLGNSHDGGGGLSNYYQIAPTKNFIRYTDSGLAPAFNHTIAMPDRGRFLAENLDVSSDTLMVVNAYGEIQTRLFDYDTAGPDSMFFEYDYSGQKKGERVIALPGESWLKHKTIPLEGRAQISTRIAITSTGQHNKDRELRVAGYDKDGTPGYYCKAIFDQKLGDPVRQEIAEWQFKADRSLVLDRMELLDPADTDPDTARAATRKPLATPRWQRETKPPLRGPSQDLRFAGNVQVGKDVFACEVPDFNLDESPARLRLKHGNDTIEVLLHTVEKWTHYPTKLHGRDGTPKQFQVTLEIPPEARATKNPALRRAIEQSLEPWNLRTFDWFATATEDYLHLESLQGPKGAAPFWLSMGREGRPYSSLAAMERDAIEQSRLQTIARKPSLQIGKALAETTRADAPFLRALVAENQKALQVVDNEAAQLQKAFENKPFWLRGWLFKIIGFLAKIPGLIVLIKPLLPFDNVSNEEAKYYTKVLAKSMPSLLERSETFKDLLAHHEARDQARAKAIIVARIAAYEHRLVELQAGHTHMAFSYSERVEDMWAPLRFGTRTATTALQGQWTVSDDGMFDATKRRKLSGKEGPKSFTLDVATADKGTLGLRIVPLTLESDLLAASASGGLRRVSTKVRLQAEAFQHSAQARALLAQLFGNAANQEREGTLVIEDGHYRLIGAGFDLRW